MKRRPERSNTRTCSSYIEEDGWEYAEPGPGRFRKSRRQRRSGNKALTVVLSVIIVLAVGVLGFSVYKLLSIRSSYQQADDVYAQIERFVSGSTDQDSGQEDLIPDEAGLLGDVLHGVELLREKRQDVCGRIDLIRQSGELPFRLGDIYNDEAVLKQAEEAAQKTILSRNGNTGHAVL